MPIIELEFQQTITHWAQNGLDQFGVPSWSGPNTLKGLWEERRENTVDANGNEIVSNAIVTLSADVKTGDYLMLGSVASGETDPTAISGTWEVKNFQKNPSLLEKGTFTREATL